MIRALSQVFAPAPLPRELRLELATSSNVLMSAMGNSCRCCDATADRCRTSRVDRGSEL